MKLEYLLEIISAVAVPVVVLDGELSVIAANKGAHQAFPDLSIGIPATDAISKKSGFIKRLQQVLENSAEKSMTLKTKERSGQEFTMTVKRLGAGPATPASQLLLTFEDRSPLKDAKIMRSDFVANVSHEMRSPLTAITGFIETLQSTAKDEPQTRAYFLELMDKEAARMVNLVADLLSLSQVEAKQRRRPKKNIDPNLIVAQALNAVRQSAQNRGITLAYHAQDTLPEVPGLHDDLVRVFINLLENAINYGRESSEISVTARVADSENPLGQPAILISVTDQGEGIPAADVPHLTERFYRVDKSRSRSVGGTGLGLAIVKHILVRHRGKMLIESTVGQGSTFSVYLPVKHTKKV